MLGCYGRLLQLPRGTLVSTETPAALHFCAAEFRQTFLRLEIVLVEIRIVSGEVLIGFVGF